MKSQALDSLPLIPAPVVTLVVGLEPLTHIDQAYPAKATGLPESIDAKALAGRTADCGSFSLG